MSQIKIVNVEDDRSSREAISEILRLEGFTVLEAATGKEALRIVAEAKPQLVVLDVRLPDINGYELCRRIRVQVGAAPVIIALTAARQHRKHDM